MALVPKEGKKRERKRRLEDGVSRGCTEGMYQSEEGGITMGGGDEMRYRVLGKLRYGVGLD